MADSLPANTTQQLDNILKATVDTRKVPSVFLGVTRPDGIAYMNQAGHNIFNDPSSGEINEDSVFWLCSQTKLVTSIAALQLIDEGKIQLTTPVAEILPELADPVVLVAYSEDGSPITRPAKTPITLGHLLNHSSGLSYELQTRDHPFGLSAAYTHSYRKDNAVEKFYEISRGHAGKQQLLKFEPGTDFSYGTNSDAIGFLVERLTGLTLEEYFQRHIFAPLGVQASFYCSGELQKRRIPLHFLRDDGTLELWNGQIEISEQDPSKVNLFLGGVGLYASQKDYLAILRHILQILDGTADKPILSLERTRSLFEPTLPERAVQSLNASAITGPGAPGGSQWGTGLRLTTGDWPGMRSHGSGNWGGWANTVYWIDPKEKVAVVYGTQSAPPYNKEFMKAFPDVEKTIYAGLRARQGTSQGQSRM